MLFWTKPGSSIPQNCSCTVSYLLFHNLFKLANTTCWARLEKQGRTHERDRFMFVATNGIQYPKADTGCRLKDLKKRWMIRERERERQRDRERERERVLFAVSIILWWWVKYYYHYSSIKKVDMPLNKETKLNILFNISFSSFNFAIISPIFGEDWISYILNMLIKDLWVLNKEILSIVV